MMIHNHNHYKVHDRGEHNKPIEKQTNKTTYKTRSPKKIIDWTNDLGATNPYDK
jgi:hypothetical protein